MLPEKIMQSDLLDILFENRNKTYGAYTLRKFYNKRMITSIICTLSIALLFSVLQLFHHTKTEKVIAFIIPPDINPLKLLPDKPVIPPSHTRTVNHFKQVINSTPVITDDKDAKPPLKNDELDKAVIASFATGGKDDNGIIKPPVDLQKSPGVNVAPAPAISEDNPVTFAQVMPEFPGGNEALIKFILRNIHQPDDLQQGEKIKVIASFIVAKNGAIENIKIINSGRTDLDKEVLRVINKMPLWKPGKQNGKPVSVYFNLPVTFQTADE